MNKLTQFVVENENQDLVLNRNGNRLVVSRYEWSHPDTDDRYIVLLFESDEHEPIPELALDDHLWMIHDRFKKFCQDDTLPLRDVILLLVKHRIIDLEYGMDQRDLGKGLLNYCEQD